MAKKNEKKVSVAEIEKIVKTLIPDDGHSFEWNGLEIKYRESIPMLDMVQFVDNVVDGCFGEDGSYRPEFKEFLFNSYMVSSYTNIRLPQNIEKQYVIVTETDLAEAVFSRINRRQYGAMCEAVEEKIRYIRDADIQATRKNLDSLIEQFGDIGDRLAKAFDGVSGEEIIQLIAAMNAGELDESKLVEAFLAHKETADDAVVDATEIEKTDDDGDAENKIVTIERR